MFAEASYLVESHPWVDGGRLSFVKIEEHRHMEGAVNVLLNRMRHVPGSFSFHLLQLLDLVLPNAGTSVQLATYNTDNLIEGFETVATVFGAEPRFIILADATSQNLGFVMGDRETLKKVAQHGLSSRLPAVPALDYLLSRRHHYLCAQDIEDEREREEDTDNSVPLFHMPSSSGVAAAGAGADLEDDLLQMLKHDLAQLHSRIDSLERKRAASEGASGAAGAASSKKSK